MANSPGYSSNGLVSPSMAIKISLILVSGITLFVLAKLSIPHISNLLSIAVPQIWAIISAWLAPPYLFITVHFIILVIWKLSDHKPSRKHQWGPHQEQHQHQFVKPKQQLTREISPEILGVLPTRAGDEWAPSGEPVVLLKQNLSGEREILPVISREEPGYFQWAPREEQTVPKKKISREKSPKNSRNISNKVSFSDESCVTEEKSDEKSTASSHLEMRRNERPVPVPEREFVRRVEPDPDEPAVVEEGEVDEDDSMDATWKAIMEKTKTPRPVVPTSRRATEPEPSVGADEMNQRFEDFIRKSRFAMTNAAF